MKRVVVPGRAGAGKSVLAQKLSHAASRGARVLGVPRDDIARVWAAVVVDGDGAATSAGFGLSASRKAEERERRDGIARGEYRVRGTDLPTPGGG